ncbi:MAG: very short patch repair endonuclease [Thermodesulfovibrionales bacterium]|nr:very short patch repair endonuclease [Thermodesulfovibrionales bacterium]
MDTFSKTERSRIMASVKSRNTKSTELRFISILKDKGIAGWRRNYPLTGKPDFVFPRLKIAVFIDGCFWHSCHSHCRMPSSNVNYWNNKIEKNKIRDGKITKVLKMKGWQVIRIWEHEIKTGRLNQKLKRIKETAQPVIQADR